MARGVALALDGREEISRGIVAGESGRAIAARLGRHYSVVNREIWRNGGRLAYRAMDAERNAADSARRPRARKVERDPHLRAAVDKGLALKWSPRQISTRLRALFRRLDQPLTGQRPQTGRISSFHRSRITGGAVAIPVYYGSQS